MFVVFNDYYKNRDAYNVGEIQHGQIVNTSQIVNIKPTLADLKNPDSQQLYQIKLTDTSNFVIVKDETGTNVINTIVLHG